MVQYKGTPDKPPDTPTGQGAARSLTKPGQMMYRKPDKSTDPTKFVSLKNHIRQERQQCQPFNDFPEKPLFCTNTVPMPKNPSLEVASSEWVAALDRKNDFEWQFLGYASALKATMEVPKEAPQNPIRLARHACSDGGYREDKSAKSH